MNACIIVPVYNHAEFLPPVMEAALDLRLPIIAVNDGSTDQTAACLARWPLTAVITLARNQGKGRALAAGLKKAEELGYALAAVLDADGQHDPAGIPRLLAAAGEAADTIVIGARETGQEGAPRKSRFGRAFSNFWVWVETGRWIPDTQSGLRVYPVARMNRLRISSRRFGWEIEALVRAAWSGVKTVSLPVRISYAAKARSHFRTFRDFFLVSCVNARLVAERLLGLPLRLPRAEGWPQDWPGRWQQLRGLLWLADESAFRRALAVSLGFFFSIFPIWGWQTVTALYLAHRLRLNKLITLAAVNLSIPPMIPVIVYAALVLGRGSLQGVWGWSLPLTELSLQTGWLHFKEFLWGSMILASVVAAAGGLASYPLFRLGSQKRTTA